MENEGSSSAASPKASEGIGGWIESVVVTSSQTSLGQAVFKLIDTFLWVVEKSAQWSLPSHEIAAEENGKTFGKIELVRPLPWILFLPGLVILRIIRGGVNAAAFVLGYPRIQPSGMVKFVQKGRRRLRAFNLKAVKSARLKIPSAKAATPDEKSTTESAGSPMHTDAKRKYSQISSDDESTSESENETLLSKIDRLALDDSTDDPDFNPAECSTDSSTSSSESETEKTVPLAEFADISKDADEFLQNNKKSTVTSKTEEEEEEEENKMPEKPSDESNAAETSSKNAEQPMRSPFVLLRDAKWKN